jgi:hypothetical protein
MNDRATRRRTWRIASILLEAMRRELNTLRVRFLAKQCRILGERLHHGTHLNLDDAPVNRLCAGQEDCFCHIFRVKHP